MRISAICGTSCPQAAAIIFSDLRGSGRHRCSFTYGEFDRLVNRTANFLRLAGVKKGDNVAIQLYNSPEYVSATFALAKIGAVAVPINMQLVFGECAFQFDRCAIRTVICEPDCQATISPTPCPRARTNHLWKEATSILWSACSSATAVGRARRRCRGLRRRGRCVR